MGNLQFDCFGPRENNAPPSKMAKSTERKKPGQPRGFKATLSKLHDAAAQDAGAFGKFGSADPLYQEGHAAQKLPLPQSEGNRTIGDDKL